MNNITFPKQLRVQKVALTETSITERIVNHQVHHQGKTMEDQLVYLVENLLDSNLIEVMYLL